MRGYFKCVQDLFLHLRVLCAKTYEHRAAANFRSCLICIYWTILANTVEQHLNTISVFLPNN